MNKVMLRIILFFLIISLVPFMRGCEDHPVSYGFPTVAVDGNPVESENYIPLGIIINFAALIALSALVWQLYRKKKLNFAARRIKWGLYGVLIFCALHIIIVLLIAIDGDVLGYIGLPILWATHFMTVLLLMVFEIQSAGMLFPKEDDLFTRLGFLLASIVYFWAGFGLHYLVNFLKKKFRK